jgi:hypothetical protein
MTVEELNARDDLLELAELVELVAALDPRVPASGAGAGIGPRLPPGVQVLLDADEHRRALDGVAEWSTHWVSVLDVDCPLGRLVPAALRLLAERVSVVLGQLDEARARAFVVELGRHLRLFRRLARRGVRPVRTGVLCPNPMCRGHLVSPLGGENRSDAALRCDRCDRTVPYVVWSGWPRARVMFITVDHAARLLGTSPAAVKMRAARLRWRRVGTGRDVRYHVDDVRASAEGA